MKKVITNIILLILAISLNGQDKINPNGYNRIYYPNGSLQSEGKLVNGKPEGYWKNYFPTGVKKSEGIRKNFLLDSIWVFYTITGDTAKKISYLNGKKNGFSYEYVTTTENPINIGNILKKELYVNEKREGNSYYFYKTGQVKEVVNYENNRKEGQSIEYDKEGKIITIKEYRKGTLIEREKINRLGDDNTKQRTWKSFYPDMKVKTEAYYKNGLLDGYYKEYDQNGGLIVTILYRDGKLIEEVSEDDIETNEIVKYNNDGSIKSTGFYKNKKPVGLHKLYSKENEEVIAKIFNDNGQIISKGKIDKEGNRIGTWEEYYLSGTVKAKGDYKNNRKEGKWRYFSKKGIIEQEGGYSKGKYDGLWTYYYPDKTVWKEEEYFNGLREGTYNEYDKSGNVIVSGDYFDGEREGGWTTVINDHKAVGKYVNGLMDGKWKYFYKDDVLHFEGNFVQGNADGKHKYYYPNGNLKEEQYYSSGIRQKNWRKYTEDGLLKITITYKNNMEYRINGVKVDFVDYIPTVIK